MITVACVWVKANVPYDAIYVERLRSMVRRHLRREHRFVCFTDRPDELPASINTIKIPSPGALPGWWSKVHLFDDWFDGRVIYLDLDVLIVAALDPFIDINADFAICPPGGTFQGRDGLKTVRRYNSSVIVWDAGVRSCLFNDWTPKVAERLWGDQDWIGEQLLNERKFPAAWVPRYSELEKKEPGPKAKVILCKVPKPHVAAREREWVAETWA